MRSLIIATLFISTIASAPSIATEAQLTTQKSAQQEIFLTQVPGTKSVQKTSSKPTSKAKTVYHTERMNFLTFLMMFKDDKR